jgi:hypothetical protein
MCTCENVNIQLSNGFQSIYISTNVEVEVHKTINFVISNH